MDTKTKLIIAAGLTFAGCFAVGVTSNLIKKNRKPEFSLDTDKVEILVITENE